MLFFWCFFFCRKALVCPARYSRPFYFSICEPLAAANAHNDGNDGGDGGGGGGADDCDDDDDTFVSAVDEAMERLSSERPSLTTTSSLVTFMAK